MQLLLTNDQELRIQTSKTIRVISRAHHHLLHHTVHQLHTIDTLLQNPAAVVQEQGLKLIRILRCAHEHIQTLTQLLISNTSELAVKKAVLKTMKVAFVGYRHRNDNHTDSNNNTIMIEARGSRDCNKFTDNSNNPHVLHCTSILQPLLDLLADSATNKTLKVMCMKVVVAAGSVCTDAYKRQVAAVLHHTLSNTKEAVKLRRVSFQVMVEWDFFTARHVQYVLPWLRQVDNTAIIMKIMDAFYNKLTPHHPSTPLRNRSTKPISSIQNALLTVPLVAMELSGEQTQLKKQLTSILPDYDHPIYINHLLSLGKNTTELVRKKVLRPLAFYLKLHSNTNNNNNNNDTNNNNNNNNEVELGIQGIIKHLVRLLKDKSVEVRKEAVKILENLEDSRQQQMVIAELHSLENTKGNVLYLRTVRMFAYNWLQVIVT